MSKVQETIVSQVLAPDALRRGVILFLIVFFAYHLFRAIFFDRLAKVPSAHWSCSFSPFWILWQRYNGNELKAIREAHQKLGTIVRVGPQDLSISDYQTGVRQVYNAGFEKPHYFNFYQYYGRVSSCYSKTTLFASKQLKRTTEKMLFERLVPELQNAANLGQPVELLRLCYAISLDALNCYIFGVSSGPNFTQNPQLLEAWLNHYENRYCKESFWLQEMPSVARGLQRLGLDVMPRYHYESTEWIENWMLEHCRKAEEVCLKIEQGDEPEIEDFPSVYQQIRTSMARAKDGKFLGRPLTKDLIQKSIASELFDHMCMVFAYMIYYLAQHPEQQDRLRQEVSVLGEHLDDSEDALPPPDVLQSLDYLQAVIKESLRMRPNSTPLPRITPHDREVSIAGVDGIPPGTRVNCFQWLLHRNPEVWEQPDSWVPERWLDADGKERRDMPPLWSFVTGPRACIGMQLTYYFFNYMLSVMSSNFTFEVARPETYGRHSPGTLEDEIYVTVKPVVAAL
ncbi:hypothetical protein KVR01_009065 [Diaporthe batatas]|uniref:uncharacterized protein n=1 Tax=Diaporthe batatas TaxID=748121 RepID=UPI001D0532E0|nr:uncharacterized protein KVR01_009065 [Diaporthe batatas]KAG8160801.1 hypothetical protein KVR01_009065 [Diaporthe batatas]